MTVQLTIDELSELERLDAEHDRCLKIADDGNDGFYMQVTYAHEELGRQMADRSKQLLAMARRLLELESALTFLLHARDPDFDFGDKTGAEIELRCAERMGWKGLERGGKADG